MVEMECSLVMRHARIYEEVDRSWVQRERLMVRPKRWCQNGALQCILQHFGILRSIL